jgi:ornithine carbamoyltransferase
MFDVSPTEVQYIFELADDLKTKLAQGMRENLFPGRVVGLLFEKPSLRTRVSFEAAAAHLGGSSIYLGQDVGWGQREATQDFSRVVSQYLDVLVCRTKDHATLEDVAKACCCPVINGLTNIAHPCQAMSDLYTLRELCGSIRGRTVAFVGDGNNVARSLAVGCAQLGVHLVIASPPAYRLDAAFLQKVHQAIPQARITLVDEPAKAVAEACAVYTDVWASMGQESERRRRQRDFNGYQVNAQLMSKAPAAAYFMHCLPARRGEEVTDEVIDGPQSVVIQQAANRLHVQKGILAWLFPMRPR